MSECEMQRGIREHFFKNKTEIVTVHCITLRLVFFGSCCVHAIREAPVQNFFSLSIDEIFAHFHQRRDRADAVGILSAR